MTSFGESCLSIKAQSSVYFGRDASWNNLENLGAETNKQLVHEGFGLGFFISALLIRVFGRRLNQVLILRTLRGAIEQGWVSRSVLRLNAGNCINIPGIRHHNAVFLQ